MTQIRNLIKITGGYKEKEQEKFKRARETKNRTNGWLCSSFCCDKVFPVHPSACPWTDGTLRRQTSAFFIGTVPAPHTAHLSDLSSVTPVRHPTQCIKWGVGGQLSAQVIKTPKRPHVLHCEQFCPPNVWWKRAALYQFVHGWFLYNYSLAVRMGIHVTAGFMI